MLCRAIVSWLIASGTFGTTFSLNQASCCSWASQISETQKPFPSSLAGVKNEARCFLAAFDQTR